MQQQNSFNYFCNKDCEYFPCHKGVDAEKFNCLFCFCPLYMLGDKCGGKFVYSETKNRIKSCTNCELPHNPDYYDEIITKLKEVMVSSEV